MNTERNTKISERISQIIDYKGISINKFSSLVGASNSYFNKLIKNGSTIGSDRIEKIIYVFPEINPEWLLTGKGKMIKAESDINYNFNSELNIPLLLQYLLDNNDKLIKDESFRNYVKMNMEYITTDDERTAKLKALEKLKSLIKEKYSKEN